MLIVIIMILTQSSEGVDKNLSFNVASINLMISSSRVDGLLTIGSNKPRQEPSVPMALYEVYKG